MQYSVQDDEYKNDEYQTLGQYFLFNISGSSINKYIYIEVTNPSPILSKLFDNVKIEIGQGNQGKYSQ